MVEEKMSLKGHDASKPLEVQHKLFNVSSDSSFSQEFLNNPNELIPGRFFFQLVKFGSLINYWIRRPSKTPAFLFLPLNFGNILLMYPKAFPDL